MASELNDNSTLSANRMRLSDRIKSISKGIKMYLYSEYTEDRGGPVNSTEAVQDGAVVGRYVQKDGKTVETSASADAQVSGDHAKMAEAAGVKKEDIRSTTPEAVARDMKPSEGSDLGKGPAKVGAISDKQADTPSKPEQTEKADLHPKSEPKSNNNADKPKEGKKPDNSLFKPKGSKDAGAEGDFKAEKADMGKASKQPESKAGAPKEGKPDKSMSQMASIKTGPTDSKLEKAYDIKVEPGKITYSNKTSEQQQAQPSKPQAPQQKWKESWNAKSPQEKQAFSQKLSQDRWMKPTQAIGRVMRKTSDEGPSEGYKALLAQMQKKKASKPGTREQKIENALAQQARSGSPYAEYRPSATHTDNVARDRPNLRADYEAHRDASDKSKTEKARPILLRDMARYKKFTASGRPFRVMMGTHQDHQGLVGAHHILERPMSIKEVDMELKRPTSELSRKVLDAVDGGHDSLYVHQPKTEGKQVGHLKVMKSISEAMERLTKNVLAGYGHGDQTGVPAQQMAMAGEPWSPTTHTSRPEIMNKAPKSCSQHACAFVASVRRWLASRSARMELAKAQNEEALLDNALRHMRKAKARNEEALLDNASRHMRKANPKPDAFVPAAPMPAGAPTHNPKIRAVADAYAQTKGIKLVHRMPHAEVNPERAKKIAQAFHEMPHQPNHPDVKRAYDALISETADQFKHMKAAGLKVTPIKEGQENPYKTSKDMMHDVAHNNHLWYYPTSQGFGSGEQGSDHPLLQTVETEHGPMVANDIFRIVHDYFGHAKEGFGFGPRGEENAWRHHMQMYSPDAQRALTSETRGQNSWVNFGPHGESNRKNPEKTIYADQKAGLLPDWVLKM